MSNNLDFLSIRSLNGLSLVSSDDIENIGDLFVDGNLTVSGDISAANLPDTTALEAWKTSFNNQSNGTILLKGNTDQYSSITNNSSNWNTAYTQSQTNTSAIALNTTLTNNLNSTTANRLLYRTGTSTFGSVSYGYSGGFTGDYSVVQKNNGYIQTAGTYFFEGLFKAWHNGNVRTQVRRINDSSNNNFYILSLPNITDTLASETHVSTQLDTVKGANWTSSDTIKGNATAIATNTSNISTNTSNISTNTSAIATNTSNISTNTTAISNINTNLSGLTTLENSLNSQTTNNVLLKDSANNTFTSITKSSLAGASTIVERDNTGAIHMTASKDVNSALHIQLEGSITTPRTKFPQQVILENFSFVDKALSVIKPANATSNPYIEFGNNSSALFQNGSKLDFQSGCLFEGTVDVRNDIFFRDLSGSASYPFRVVCEANFGNKLKVDNAGQFLTDSLSTSTFSGTATFNNTTTFNSQATFASTATFNNLVNFTGYATGLAPVLTNFFLFQSSDDFTVSTNQAPSEYFLKLQNDYIHSVALNTSAGAIPNGCGTFSIYSKTHNATNTVRMFHISHSEANLGYDNSGFKGLVIKQNANKLTGGGLHINVSGTAASESMATARGLLISSDTAGYTRFYMENQSNASGNRVWFLALEFEKLSISRLSNDATAFEYQNLYEFEKDSFSLKKQVSNQAAVINSGIASFGNWETASQYASFGHTSTRNTTGGYMALQDSSGQSFFNCSQNNYIRFRANNTDRWVLDDSSGTTARNIFKTRNASSYKIITDTGEGIGGNDTNLENPTWTHTDSEGAFWQQLAIAGYGGVPPLTQKFVHRYFNYGTPAGYSSAVGNAYHIGFYELRTTITVEFSCWFGSTGYKHIHLWAWCRNKSSGYAWRQLGVNWRIYNNQTSSHRYFCLSLELVSVNFPYIQYLKLSHGLPQSATPQGNEQMYSDAGDYFIVHVKQAPWQYTQAGHN